MNRDIVIIAEYCEKIGHHEPHAAHAEEERRLPQGQLVATEIGTFVKFINKVLLRWRNYENSRVLPFDEFAQKKFIEDQNTIMELSGRLQIEK